MACQPGQLSGDRAPLVGRLSGRLGALLLVGAVAVACGSSVPTATGSSGHSGESPATTAAGSSTVGAACAASVLSLSQDAKDLPNASGHAATFFAVTNNASTTCDVSGYPTEVQVFDTNGANLQIKVQNASPGPLYMFNAPPSAPITLAPHEAAYFGLTWSDEIIPSPPEGQSQTCPEGTKLQASIGGGTLQAETSLPQLCNSSATVTALASASANWGPTSP